MKRLLSFGLSIVLVISVFFSISINASAEETKEYNDVTVVSSDIENMGAYSAIQNKLNLAKNNATKDNPYRITVEAGKYVLNHSLRIYSNTTLVLDGVTLTRESTSNINLIRAGDLDTATEGVTGYNAYVNIAIIGGTFDGNATKNTIAKFAHATNISLENIAFQNTNNGHIMEVAGIDGFTIKNCSFKDQALTPGKTGYEAVQLDIIVQSHFTGYRSEDLIMKNVLIDGCTFENCPRGIGTHTAINNAPFDNIVISNNTFTNMGSAAIQGMNWKNCKIINNKINGSPRGIAVYSVMKNGDATFSSSTLAKEGNTTAHYSDAYKTPINSNIVIAENTLNNCGNIKDEYASYESGGIFAVGYDLSDVEPKNNIAKGNYYLSGVSIYNNYVKANGHGVRLMGTKNIDITSNELKCGANTLTPANYYGISAYQGEAGNIKYNFIDNAAVNGIYIYKNSAAKSIVGNVITSASKYGIGVDTAKVGEITDNDINIKSDAKKYIYVSSNAKATLKNNLTSDFTSVSKLSVSNVGKHTADLSWGAVKNAKGYIVYKKDYYTKMWVKIATTDKTSYSVKDISSETKHEYAVKAYKTESKENHYSKSFASAGFTTLVDTALKYGDANYDGKINMSDVLILRKHLARWSVLISLTYADCNADTKINMADVLLLRKYLAKWNVTLGK